MKTLFQQKVFSAEWVWHDSIVVLMNYCCGNEHYTTYNLYITMWAVVVDYRLCLPSVCLFTQPLFLIGEFTVVCDSELSMNCFTWKFFHAVRRAEVVLQGTVCIHGNIEVELWSKGEQRPSVVGVFDGPNTNTQQPVHIQHLVLDRQTDRESDYYSLFWSPLASIR